MRLEDLHQKSEEKVIVFYDGVCNLCNGFVRFVSKRDSNHKILFCPLQDGAAQEVRKELSQEQDITTVIALWKGKYYLYSDVTFLICSTLGSYWYLLMPLKFIPRPMRNYVYNWVARNRYNWFGKNEVCEMLGEEERERFVVAS